MTRQRAQVKSCGKTHAHCKVCRPEIDSHPPGSKKRAGKPEELEPRFWSKVDFDGPIHPDMGTPCWLWTGSTAKGYGQFKVGPKNLKAHRVAWMLLKGDIAKGLVLDHKCKTPVCINVNHLEPVTNAENMRRITPSVEPHRVQSREVYQLGRIYSLYRYLRAIENQKQSSNRSVT